jgi:hypothetical protein
VSSYKPWTVGLVRAHPRPYDFTMDSQIRAPHLFHNQAISQACTFTTLTQHSTSTPLPEPERYGFTPKKGITQVPCESWSDSSSASWGSPEFEPGFLPVWWVSSQVGSWAFPGSFVQPELTSSAHWKRAPSPDQHGPVAPGRGSPPGRLGTLNQWQGDKNTTLQISGGPPEMLLEGSDRDWRAPKLSGSKFIKQASSNSADSCLKAEPWEQRGLSLHTI